MIEVAKKRKFSDPSKFHFESKDVFEMQLENSSIILSYYTLQFILPSVRQELINRVYKSLSWGGAFLYLKRQEGQMVDFKI